MLGELLEVCTQFIFKIQSSKLHEVSSYLSLALSQTKNGRIKIARVINEACAQRLLIYLLISLKAL